MTRTRAPKKEWAQILLRLPADLRDNLKLLSSSTRIRQAELLREAVVDLCKKHGIL